MSMNIDSILTMSSFEGLIALIEYRQKYPGYSDKELIQILRCYPDKNNLDYHKAIQLEKIITIEKEQTNNPSSLRQILKQIILSQRPSWIYAITFGRNEILNNLDDMPNIKQCFKSAHLFDENPSFEIIEWWDEISALIRSEKDITKIQNGRKGERLSLEYEIRNLKKLQINKKPQWSALEDNSLGYDIKSFTESSFGPNIKLIEVKSCSSNNIIIFLTRNEWNTAKKYISNYFFHIWHLPSETLICELSVNEMEPYILQNKNNAEWTILEIDFNHLKSF